MVLGYIFFHPVPPSDLSQNRHKQEHIAAASRATCFKHVIEIPWGVLKLLVFILFKTVEYQAELDTLGHAS